MKELLERVELLKKEYIEYKKGFNNWSYFIGKSSNPYTTEIMSNNTEAVLKKENEKVLTFKDYKSEKYNKLLKAKEIKISKLKKDSIDSLVKSINLIIKQSSYNIEVFNIKIYDKLCLLAKKNGLDWNDIQLKNKVNEKVELFLNNNEEQIMEWDRQLDLRFEVRRIELLRFDNNVRLLLGWDKSHLYDFNNTIYV